MESGEESEKYAVRELLGEVLRQIKHSPADLISEQVFIQILLMCPCIFGAFADSNSLFCSTNCFFIDIDNRRKNDIIVPQHWLTLTERSFNYVGIKLFNALPADVRESHQSSAEPEAGLKISLEEDQRIALSWLQERETKKPSGGNTAILSICSEIDNLPTFLKEWRKFQITIPTYGAIIISEDNSHVLMAQWYSGNWSFHKVKMKEVLIAVNYFGFDYLPFNLA
ncbi:hypothetical protein HHI36_003697 [Cryptolaemus montrouzieri]|uniref:Uncharacterized protein n=1 Tax=Cryptolaemus montrouzieri TaxID=559131 RepID=A0ABD2PE68_9CUCU